MPEAAVSDRRASAASALKMPPHNVEAEQSVLGGLMLVGDAWDRVADILNEGDFYRRDHRLIFGALHALVDQGKPLDVVTVSEYLDTNDQIDEAGGLGYLGELVHNTPGAANIKTYAEIVRERSVVRQLISAGNEIAESGFNTQGRGVNELIDEAESKVFAITDQSAKGGTGFVPVKEVLVNVMERIEKLSETKGALTGVSSGFADLDHKTSGLQPSDLIIVAGRPSMGKTAFAMNLCETVAIKERKGVAIFSMEMPAEQLIMRMISSLGRIDQQKVRSGRLSDDDWPRITSAMGMLNDTQLYIDDTPALTPTELRARCRRLTRECDLGLVVVDYLQLMQVAGSKENRATEISEISRSLKALAKELSVPVVAVSQLNRSLEQRPDKRPVMSDLRESGAIEQDADLILFIYRDEVYNEDSADKGRAEIIIGKQRNGPIGKVSLTFLGQYTRFDNYSPDDYSGGYYPC